MVSSAISSSQNMRASSRGRLGRKAPQQDQQRLGGLAAGFAMRQRAYRDGEPQPTLPEGGMAQVPVAGSSAGRFFCFTSPTYSGVPL
jgi:hypothetical protein